MKKKTSTVFNKFTGLSTILLMFLFVSYSESSNSDVEIRLERKVPRPAWFDDNPIVVAGGWDSEPATQRRWGDLTIDYMDQYEKRMSEQTVTKLKEMGITLVITHYFKGYGMVGEGPYMESTREFAELCHKHGIRVGVYIGNTIIPEQLLLEKPEAEDWLVPDYLGEPRTYGNQTFRRIPYIGHPEYKEYIKEVLKKAILEAKVDFIHFDNSAGYGSHANFHHPVAIEQFRDFLRDKYTPEQLEDRFSFKDVKYVMPPKFHRGVPQPLRDPLFQEFTDFRCWKVSEFLREMSQYIKKLNPEVVVEGNPMGDSGENMELHAGRDLARMLPYTEAFWHENEKDPCVMGNGSLVSRIRSFKIGQIFDNKLFYHSGHDKQLMAEGMAYGGSPGYIGALLSPYYWDEDAIRYVQFFHDHFQYYKHARNIAPVAVLRSFPSMAYSDDDTRYSTYLYEQTLIQRKIPFDIIFDDQLKEGLSKYRVLIIANQECMTDEQIELVRVYVEAGGGLVITGKSSLYNDWYRRRNRLGLRDLFSEDLPYPPGTVIGQYESRVIGTFTGIYGSPWYSHSSKISELKGFTEKEADRVKGEYEKGRIVYIPHVKPGLDKPSNASPTSQYWKLPKNYEELEDAVRWAAGEPIPIEIRAPLHVTMEWTQQPEVNRMMVHLMNYDIQNHPMVEDISIRIKLPEGKQIKDVNVFSPDKGVLSEILSYQINDGWIDFTVPNLHVYDMIAIQYNK